MKSARMYLLGSAAGLVVIAASYGVAPAVILPKLFDFTVTTRDLTHIFRAVTGLYLGMIVLWVLGARHAGLTRTAVIAEITFMFGLVSGRLVSFAVDGLPSTLLIVYAVLEAVLGTAGLVVLNKLPQQPGSNE